MKLDAHFEDALTARPRSDWHLTAEGKPPESLLDVYRIYNLVFAFDGKGRIFGIGIHVAGMKTPVVSFCAPPSPPLGR